MPKVKPTVDEWIRNIPELTFENNKLFCRACVKTIQCEKKFNILQHVKSNHHKERLTKFQAQKSKQKTIPEALASTSRDNEQTKFNYDLCKTMVQCNIPLRKLDNSAFRNFLETYCKRHVPAESTLRKNYVSSVYTSVLSEIKILIENNYVWFSVDETTDSCGRYIANLIIGVLKEDIPTKGYLVSSRELPKTNSNTISRFVNEELIKIFLPNALPHEKIILMVSDAAPYMVKAAENLKIFYPKLMHVTCLAHGLNRVAETIRMQFPLVNELIKNGKKVFVKAPLRVQVFREMAPGIPLPPQPVITRWGTWLDAAVYYANNLKIFKQVILQFEENSQSLKDCQAALQSRELEQNLAFIQANYAFVSISITKLQKQGSLLTESLKVVEDLKTVVNRVPGKIGDVVKNKLNEVLLKNKGFLQLKKISKVLSGEIVTDLDFEPLDVPMFKYAPITSVDVERSFSAYKNVFSDKRRSFKTDNLEQYLIINCYHNEEDDDNST